MEHAPEPWKLNHLPDDDFPIIHDSTGLPVLMGTIEEANAKRIVACVNFCAGVSTEDLSNVSAKYLQIERDNAKNQLSRLKSENETLKHGWRCFHCDELFSDKHQARLHFGDVGYYGAYGTPACCVDAAHLRDLEKQLSKYRNDDTDLHRQIHASAAKESAEQKLELAESKVRDMKSTYEFGAKVMNRLVIPRTDKIIGDELPFDALERWLIEKDKWENMPNNRRPPVSNERCDKEHPSIGMTIIPSCVDVRIRELEQRAIAAEQERQRLWQLFKDESDQDYEVREILKEFNTSDSYYYEPTPELAKKCLADKQAAEQTIAELMKSIKAFCDNPYNHGLGCAYRSTIRNEAFRQCDCVVNQLIQSTLNKKASE